MKLSEEFVKDLVKQVGEGCVSLSALAAKNGINVSTATRWRSHGNRLLEQFGYDREKTLNHIYKTATMTDMKYAIGCVMFAFDIPVAVGELKAKLNKVVINEGLQEPKMALNILERIEPQQWAKKVQFDGKIEENKTITQIVVHRRNEPKQLEEQYPINAEFTVIEDGT